MESHILNKEKKRFEAQSTTCAFCEEQKSAPDIEKHCYVPVFKEKDRVNVIVYRSVSFGRVDIGIPRCEGCAYVHYRSNYISNAIAVISALILIIGGFSFNILIGFLCCFIALIFCFPIHLYLPDYLIRKKRCKTKSEAALEDRLIVDFLANGWSLYQPMT